MDKEIHKISEIKNDIICYLSVLIAENGLANLCAETLGEITDMIKDLAEAEEKCHKACYYKKVVEAMEEYEDEDGPMGYDHYRYASGRFAPKGKGHYSAGYTPMTRMMDEPDHHMGYPTRDGGMREGRSDYGRHYDEYKKARSGYHDTRSAEDKRRMDEHAKEHMTEAMETMRDIWGGADQTLKQKMKADMTNLVKEMNV